MSSRKRGRYQVYHADKSVPEPKVTLWRSRKADANVEVKSFRYETDVQNDPKGPRELVDSFHANLFEQALTEPVEDPDATEIAANNQGEYQDEDFEIDDTADEDDGSQEAVNSQSSSDDADKPLYDGATITLAASMVLLISFAMRHSLTGEALADLLMLVELHCLAPNLCQRNLKTFMAFFRSFRSPLQFHYYCEKCYLYHGIVKQDICQNCHTSTKRKSTAYFLVIPLVSQLSTLFADGTLVRQILAYKNTMQTKRDESITDICDGKLYKERFQKNGFFHGSTADPNQLHISFQMNTDGVSLFHSSSFSIWPVYFIINELPPNLRFSRSNRIFAGLWFGYSKPDFSTFLKPFAESLHDMYLSGLVVDNLHIRGILLNAVFDSPARCLFQNMVQFNGFCGCPYCYAPGKSVQTSERGHTLTYPFNYENPNGHHELRTHLSNTRDGEEAEQKKATGVGNIRGVKGLGFFNYLPNFDIVRGVSVDYMHCVLLGVMKMLMTLWFNKTHRNEHFSISTKAKEVDQRLLNIKPPKFLTRFPRSLTEVSHFKAAELKNFLLYYSLPCLFGILPMDQFNHFSLLVYAIYIFLQQNITAKDILQCRKFLLEFVINVPIMYGERYMTSNVHLLLHLADKVEDLGPLWCSSCFYFEDFNGQLRRLFHGTQHIETQIAFAAGVHQSLPKIAQSLKVGSCEQDLFEKMMTKNIQRTSENISEAVSVVGAFSCRPCTEEELGAIQNSVGNVKSVTFFKRLYSRQQIIHSVNYHASSRRNNSVIKLQSGSYGQVQNFVKVIPVCACIRCNCRPVFMAFMREMDRADNILMEQQRCSDANHMVPVRSPNGPLQAVLVQDISDVCICVNIEDNLSFLSAVPNRIEKE